jgi:hypothetical protein
MPDAVDPRVGADQRADAQPMADLLEREAGAEQLPARDDAVLARGDRADDLLGRPIVVVHDPT